MQPKELHLFWKVCFLICHFAMAKIQDKFSQQPSRIAATTAISYVGLASTIKTNTNQLKVIPDKSSKRRYLFLPCLFRRKKMGKTAAAAAGASLQSHNLCMNEAVLYKLFMAQQIRKVNIFSMKNDVDSQKSKLLPLHWICCCCCCYCWCFVI